VHSAPDAGAAPAPEEPCELLAWDSRHFGRRIGRVRGGTLSAPAVAAIDRWCARQAVECLYLLVPAGDVATPALAEAAGFRLVDVRITLERRLASGGESGGPDAAAGEARSGGDAGAAGDAGEAGAAGEGARVRAARPADLPALRRIASVSHHDSRFYSDPHFDRERCDALYAAWIERSAADPDGAVLVAETAAAPGRVAGYITVERRGEAGGGREAAGGGTLGGAGSAPRAAGQIGLFAVAGEAQGQGLGGRLIAAAFGWFAAQGVARIGVVTQGRNVRAQRIYQRSGLVTGAVELWFHRWTAGGAPEPGSGG
jgi:dTDP-4-amino-4,6-dideoxy-D-galactose acyltransferase